MEIHADDHIVFMAFSAVFLVLALLSTQRLGLASHRLPSTSLPTDSHVDVKSLPMDTALLQLTLTSDIKPVNVFGLSSNCHKCIFEPLAKNLKYSLNVTVETNFPVTLFVNDSEGTHVCENKTETFGEHGFYIYTIHGYKTKTSCTLYKKIDPDNAYLPLLYAFLVILGVALTWLVLLYLLRKYNLLVNWELFHDTESLINADLGSPNFNGPVDGSGHHIDPHELLEKPKKQRLKSLDTFRGIALTIMIFVNSGGGGYYFFKHARWNGLTVADLVFPWFMWIMGVSMVISFQSMRRRQMRSITIFAKIIRRTLILFALGLFVSNYADLAHYRVPGVLQRFSACYFITAMLQLVINPGTDSILPVAAWWNPIRDVFALWGQWLVMLGLLAIYIIITFALKIGGCPRGYIGPGGLASPEAYNCTGGNAGYIDRHFFGSKHIYGHPTCMETYKTEVPYDPEGALGTLTSAFLVFLGVQAGYTLHTFPYNISRMKRWIIWSLLLGCITLALAGKNNDSVIPINKNLWSVSFIFVTGGMAFLLLTFCYVTIDVLRWWNGAPFCYPGMNSILVYVGSEILGRYFPFCWTVSGHVQHADLLAMNLVGTAVWLIISYYLYYIKFFVKI
ncbi:heparan-alpha-glucosaminide N-acetyltransferase-like [Pocillopora verrucosa]|uniref:heparan-alpha-glucosaminide N-acetyltransferase-like n=1 Tax=Pocillopora verrucosa TaxID=203993 RepID=UPI0033421D90